MSLEKTPETHHDASVLTQRCRVVLVRPSISANVGSVARVMRNFGLSDLRFVRPHADVDESARKLSTHGEAILDAARSVAEFGEAVADCVLVVGTSGRLGGPFRGDTVSTPAELMPRLVESAHQGPVAVVFGPEQTGLTNAEVTRCHYLATIPANPAYPALNLAQAVTICLYELYKAALACRGNPGPQTVAPFEAQERAYDQLEQALRDVHFLWGDNADALMHALRHLIGRAQPTPTEVDLLFGLARQLRWYAQQYGPTP